MTTARNVGKFRKGEPSGNYTDTGPAEALAHCLSDLARSLRNEVTQDDTLRAIVRAAVETVPGAEAASISSIKGRAEVATLAATSDLSWTVDQAQYDTKEGPSLDSLYTQQSVRWSDLSAEERWPNFIEKALALEVGSMLAVQLYVAGDDLGVLNLLSSKTQAFGDESEDVALLFATHAALAMARVDEQLQLRHAINTRDLIGQAKGILMERFTLSSDHAFELLVHVSQHTNRKLTDIADELVFSGELAHTPKR